MRQLQNWCKDEVRTARSTSASAMGMLFLSDGQAYRELSCACVLPPGPTCWESPCEVWSGRGDNARRMHHKVVAQLTTVVVAWFGVLLFGGSNCGYVFVGALPLLATPMYLARDLQPIKTSPHLTFTNKHKH